MNKAETTIVASEKHPNKYNLDLQKLVVNLRESEHFFSSLKAVIDHVYLNNALASNIASIGRQCDRLESFNNGSDLNSNELIDFTEILPLKVRLLVALDHIKWKLFRGRSEGLINLISCKLVQCIGNIEDMGMLHDDPNLVRILHKGKSELNSYHHELNNLIVNAA